MNLRSRLVAVLMSLAVVLTYMPAIAFADTAADSNSISNSSTAKNNADSIKWENDAAKAALDTTDVGSAVDAARQAIEDAKADLEKAIEDKSKKDAAVADAEAALAEAKKAEENGPSRLEAASNRIAEAKANVDAANQVIARGSLGFFEAMNSTNAAKVITDRVASQDDDNTWGHTEVGQAGDATSLENMKATFALIREGNTLRKNDPNNSGDNKEPLKVSDKLMAISQVQTNASSTNIGHSQFYKGGENISWGSSDPYMGWYYEEMIHYIADKNGENTANVTEDMIDQVEALATENGHNFSAYYNRYYRSKSGFLNSLNSDRVEGNYSTGHYLNIANPDNASNRIYQNTGFAYVNKEGTQYGCAHGQFFVRNSSDLIAGETCYTVDDYEARFNEYYNKVMNDLHIAETEYDAAVDAYEALEKTNGLTAEEVKAISDAEAALKAAKADALTASDAVDAAKLKVEEALKEDSGKSNTGKDTDSKSDAADTNGSANKNNVDSNGAANKSNTADAEPETSQIKEGKSYAVSGNTFKVASKTSGTATLVKAKNVKKVTVPATVKIKGQTFKVTKIGAGAFKGSKIRSVVIGKNVKTIKKNAFKGSKVKTVTLKTTKLTKKSVKGSLKGSKVKTIKVKVGNKAKNKKYVTKYKKFFTKANAGRKATVK